jgi:hypothetical protein
LAKLGRVENKGLSYAEAERLLASLHKAPDGVRENAFRARLKHLKRLGIPLGSSPGRGSKVRYEFDQICQWAFCLELAEVGIDPAEVAELMNKNWRANIASLFRSAAESNEPLYLAIYPDLMSKSWASAASEISIVAPKYARNFFDRMIGSKRRVILINLSDLVMKLNLTT